MFIWIYRRQQQAALLLAGARTRLKMLRGCDIVDWDATEGRRVYGRVIPSEPGMRNIHLVL
jgi:hypothetical protein